MRSDLDSRFNSLSNQIANGYNNINSQISHIESSYNSYVSNLNNEFKQGKALLKKAKTSSDKLMSDTNYIINKIDQIN